MPRGRPAGGRFLGQDVSATLHYFPEYQYTRLLTDSAADSLTILEQIERALAYLDTIGTRAETDVYRHMRMVLLGAHRTLHNRPHQQGVSHEHTPVTDHPEHHPRV